MDLERNMNTASLQLNKKKIDKFQEYIIDQKYRLYTSFDITNYSSINQSEFNITTSKEIIDYLVSTTYNYPTFYNTITQSINLDDQYTDTKNILIQNRNRYQQSIQNTRNIKLKNSNFRKIDKNRYNIYTKHYDVDFDVYPAQSSAAQYQNNIQYRYPGISYYQFVNKKIKTVRYVSRHIKNWDIIHPRNISIPYRYRTVLPQVDSSGNISYNQFSSTFVANTGQYVVSPSIYNKFLLYQNNQSESLQLFFSKCIPASDYTQYSYYNNLYSTIQDRSNMIVQYSYNSFTNYNWYTALNITQWYISPPYMFTELNSYTSQLDYYYDINVNKTQSIIDIIYNDLDSLTSGNVESSFMYDSGYYTVSFQCKINTYYNGNFTNQLHATLYTQYSNTNINNINAINTIRGFYRSQLTMDQTFNFCKLILVPYDGIAVDQKYKWRCSASIYNSTQYYNLFLVEQAIKNPQVSSVFIGGHTRKKQLYSQIEMFDTIGQFCNIINDNSELFKILPENSSYYKYWFDIIQSSIQNSEQIMSQYYKIRYIIYKKFNSLSKIGIGLIPSVYKMQRHYNLSYYTNDNQEFSGSIVGDFLIYRSGSGMTDTEFPMKQTQNFDPYSYYKLLTFYGFEMKNFSIEKADIV